MIVRKTTSQFTIDAGCTWGYEENMDGSVTITAWKTEVLKTASNYLEPPNKRWTDEKLAEALALFRHGATIKELSVSYAVSVGYMRGILKKAERVEYLGELKGGWHE